jgi:hypothetical protein
MDGRDDFLHPIDNEDREAVSGLDGEDPVRRMGEDGIIIGIGRIPLPASFQNKDSVPVLLMKENEAFRLEMECRRYHTYVLRQVLFRISGGCAEVERMKGRRTRSAVPCEKSMPDPVDLRPFRDFKIRKTIPRS